MRPFLLAALVVAFAVPASAQVSFIPMAGYDLDYEAASVGLGFEFAFPQSAIPLTTAIRPSVEYVFIDSGSGFTGVDVSLFRINGDVIGRFAAPSLPIAPYAKAGLGIEVASVDIGGSSDTNTEFGLNLGAGAEINRFLGEVTLGIGDISSSRLTIGYRF